MRCGLHHVYSTYEPRTLLLAFIISRLFGLKWIADLWDDPEKMVFLTKIHKTRCQKLNILVKRIEFSLAARILRKAHKIILGLVPDRLIPKFSLSRNDVLFVTNGINLDYPLFDDQDKKNNPEEFILFYCGTVDKIRLEGIFFCIQRLLQRIHKIRLVIAGPQMGDGYQWLENECRRLDRGISLDIKGRLPYTAVLGLIAQADVCICPYPDKMDLGSAYPVKIFDYMMMGKPVVVSGLPGTSAIINHGEDALVFAPGNYAEMAEHILELHGSENLKNHLSINAQKNVRKFCWNKINQRIFDFLDL